MDVNKSKYSIAKTGIWYSVGNLIIKGLPFFTLPIFVRILSTSDFGLYNTYISYESLISIILGLGFSGTIKTAKFDFENEFETYVSSLYLVITVFTLIVSPIILLSFSLVGKFWMTLSLIVTLIVHSFSTAIFTINGVRFVISGKYIANLIYIFINTILNIGISLFLCLYVFNENRYIGRIMGTALSFVAVMLVIFFLQIHRALFSFNKKYLGYAFKMGIPLIPHLISVTLLSSCDKIMIQNMIGNAEAGIYSLSVNLISVLSVLVTSLENAWAPWFYSSLNSSRYQNIKDRNDKILMLFAYFTCGFILIAPELIKVFSTAEYTDSIYTLVPLAVSVFLNFIYLIPVNLEYFKKKTYYISAATLSCAAINLILNYFFIKKWGYIYAAHATCISKGCLLIVHCIISKKLEKNDLFSFYKAVFWVAGVISIGLITIIWANSIIIRWFLICISTCIVAFYILNIKRQF